jgi:hypothetical protein
MFSLFQCVWSRAQDSLDLEINQNVFAHSLEMFPCLQTMHHTASKWDNNKVKLAAEHLLRTVYFSQLCARLLPSCVSQCSIFIGTTQAANHQPVAGEVRVQSWTIPYGIRCGQSGAGKNIFKNFFGFPLPLFPQRS